MLGNNLVLSIIHLFILHKSSCEFQIQHKFLYQILTTKNAHIHNDKEM